MRRNIHLRRGERGEAGGELAVVRDESVRLRPFEDLELAARRFIASSLIG